MLTPQWPGKIAGDEGHERIAACLVLDIQTVPALARTVLGQIDDVVSGRLSPQKLVMNAYVLQIDRLVCEIASLYEEQGEATITVDTKTFRRALEAWIAQIEARKD